MTMDAITERTVNDWLMPAILGGGPLALSYVLNHSSRIWLDEHGLSWDDYEQRRRASGAKWPYKRVDVYALFLHRSRVAARFVVRWAKDMAELERLRSERPWIVPTQSDAEIDAQKWPATVWAPAGSLVYSGPGSLVHISKEPAFGKHEAIVLCCGNLMSFGAETIGRVPLDRGYKACDACFSAAAEKLLMFKRGEL